MSDITTTVFDCADCGRNVSHGIGPNGGAAGYAKRGNGDKVCFDCCGRSDAQLLRETKPGERVAMPLYLQCEPYSRNGSRRSLGFVTNWPNTLRLRCHTRTGSHNWGIARYDCWFAFDGSEFHGVQYGDNTEVVHVRRLKRSAYSEGYRGDSTEVFGPHYFGGVR